MSKFTLLEKRVEEYIDKNRIHLSTYAVFDKDLLKDLKRVEDEITHGKIVLTNSVGKFLMQKGRIEKYITEEDLDEINSRKLSFDAFVFSGDQLREFVKMVNSTKKSNLILMP